jgi:acetyl-CoA acetyltransferase
VDLVVYSNAGAGRLLDQGCLRGQSFLVTAGLANAGIVNVDNSCGSGSSALHLATLASRGGVGNVVAIGVEKMWTGDRAATLGAVEDGVVLKDRQWLHANLENASGSVLMALNTFWAQEILDRGATIEECAAVAVKARAHGEANPDAQFRKPVSLAEVLAAPEVVAPLTRLMCSSFTDGAAAVVLSRTAREGAPRIAASVIRSGNGELDYHVRMTKVAKAAFAEAEVSPEQIDVVELHDATAPEELFSLESLGFYERGMAGKATAAGLTTLGGGGDLVVNPSGGLLARGHPLGATGIAQVVELCNQLRGVATGHQIRDAHTVLAINTGGIVGTHAGVTDGGVFGIHILEGA